MLVATPIGNLGDFSPRALAAIKAAEVVLCEDTRVTGSLLARHGVSVTLVPFHDHNEAEHTPRLIERMRGGTRFVLVSDAGMPLMSDPGYRLVRAAIEAGLTVSAVPGPNAALTALCLSGLPPHPFLFMGFLPARGGPRQAEIGKIAAMEKAGLAATLVFYEAPHRAGEALADLARGLGARQAALARELTKRFEEVVRGTLPELAARFAETPPRGEVVLVVGPPEEGSAPAADLDSMLREAMQSMSLRDAAASVAAATGLPRKAVYARALELGREG
ncbi:16S rRNA (cytidine(1402)-2'-O)-methyltransferase [Acetobacteraceae bacterium H6797]|nr:16S rRNA (cytidine(1402)-2'-O)-methyltransferase [Acetobacteraceae bacterium H6797]